MLSANQLRPGMHVAVYKVRIQEYNGHPLSPEPSYDGTPMKILAISYPFVCVNNGKDTFGLDIREYTLVRVHGTYVRHMAAKLTSRKRKKKVKKDPKLCPRCGEGILVERWVMDPGSDSKWIIVCPICDSTGDPVPK